MKLFNFFNVISSSINKNVRKKGRNRSQVWEEKDKLLTVVDLDTVSTGHLCGAQLK